MATQKELREAFVCGFQAARPAITFDEAAAQMYARAAYPPKMVSRPREVVSESAGPTFRIGPNGCLQHNWLRSDPESWENHFSLVETRLLADLFANPTEEVEADD